MSTTQVNETQVPAAQGDLNRPSGVAQYLTPVVHDLIALAVNGKQAHWHVRRANFIAVHDFLDTAVANAQHAPDSAGRTGTPELSPGFQQSAVTVREVVAQIDAALGTIYRAIDGLDGIDPVSQDVAIAIAQQLDKDRWFLSSHFAE